MTRHASDATTAVVLAIVAGTVCAAAVASLDSRFLDPATGNDIWFEGDLARIADEMTHRWAAHSRATVHPLFALLTVPIAYGLRFAGASPAAAVATIAGLSAAAWIAACYAMLRTLGAGRGDAVLFTLLTACTAAGQFWLTVPETAALGSASMMTAIAVAAASEHVRVHDRWFVLASAASLSITVTNWIAGIVAAFASLRPARALEATGLALALVVGLWAVQRAVTPNADFFIGYSNEQRYLTRGEQGGPAAAARVLVVNGVVAPGPERVLKPNRGTVLSVQRRGLRDMTAVAGAAAVAWLALLAWGIVARLRQWSVRRGVRVLLAVVACELVLYGVYGTETFLYSLNVVPLLVGIAAGGLETSARRVVRVVAAALLIALAFSNAARLVEVRAYFTPAVFERITSMFAPTSVPSSAAPR